MARAGFCSECKMNVYLTTDGGCQFGHSLESISAIYDVPEDYVDNKSEASKPESNPTGSKLAEAESIYLANIRKWKDFMNSTEKYYSSARNDCEKQLGIKGKKKNSLVKPLEKQKVVAEKNLKVTEGWGRRKLGTFNGIKLFDDRVVTPQGTAHFYEGPVVASVDSAGNLMVSRRPTLTRALAGGAVFGPLGALGGLLATKKQTSDTRELYLIIEAPGFSSLIHCRANSGGAARAMALNINAAARNAPGIDAERERHILSAKNTLEAATKKIEETTKKAEDEYSKYYWNVYKPGIDEIAEELDKARETHDEAIDSINTKYEAEKYRILNPDSE